MAKYLSLIPIYLRSGDGRASVAKCKSASKVMCQCWFYPLVHKWPKFYGVNEIFNVAFYLYIHVFFSCFRDIWKSFLPFGPLSFGMGLLESATYSGVLSVAVCFACVGVFGVCCCQWRNCRGRQEPPSGIPSSATAALLHQVQISVGEE